MNTYQEMCRLMLTKWRTFEFAIKKVDMRLIRTVANEELSLYSWEENDRQLILEYFERFADAGLWEDRSLLCPGLPNKYA